MSQALPPFRNEIPDLDVYEDAISPAIEQSLINYIDSKEWSNQLKRLTQQYGYNYDYKTKKSLVLPDSPVEGELLDLMNWLNRTDYGPGFDRIIINNYYRNEGIAAHTDLNIFGPNIACFSLLADTCMVFTHVETAEEVRIWIKRRSLMIMTGESRYKWKHSIEPKVFMDDKKGLRIRKDDNYRRVSITFRSPA